MKQEVITFQEALDDTKISTRSLLLGNGFSRSISKRFSYENLLELANDKKMGQYCFPPDLQHLFKDLDTVDFEKVIAHLEVAQIVISAYAKHNISHICQLEQKISIDKENAKTAFVHAINYIHNDLAGNILSETYSSIGDFLYKFDSIFTLNYDLLLYWMLMRKMDVVGNANFKFDDGFTRYGWGINEKCLNNQNIFYLHGALHFFNIIDLFKIKNEEFDNITHQITEHIMNDKYPLTIMEGKYDSKKRKIKRNSYLTHCFNKIKNIKGSLFIIGASLNPHADRHIYYQIKTSNFDTIYFGIYDQTDKDLVEAIEYLGFNNQKKIVFVDPKSAITWEPID